ncbi:MAG: rhodanese-like domain-containing protein [Cytophagales bacterium]|nr:MAG: rhodanese-like domain-containing protein [Cytophagales bacterium]
MMETIKNMLGLGPKTDYKELVKNGAIILDVRTKGEFHDGHIKGAVNINLDSLQNSLSKLDKNKVIITCCASGMRSGVAKNILKSNGFDEVYNGGGWYGLESKI